MKIAVPIIAIVVIILSVAVYMELASEPDISDMIEEYVEKGYIREDGTMLSAARQEIRAVHHFHRRN